eukprot:4298787-Amphidinium_carterae.1
MDDEVSHGSRADSTPATTRTSYKERQGAEREPLLLSHYQVNPALLVKPTYLDPTSGNTTTWSTLPTDRSDINTLSVPKQQSHKRELPAVFEGNKQNEQQGPTTTFKNWAAEVYTCTCH